MGDKDYLPNIISFLIYVISPTIIALIYSLSVENKLGMAFLIIISNSIGMMPALCTAILSLVYRNKLKIASGKAWIAFSSIIGLIATFLIVATFLIIQSEFNFQTIFKLSAISVIGMMTALLSSSLILVIEWQMNRQK